MLRKNFKNIGYQTAAQIIPRAMLFVFTFYLAKTLGSTEYGKYDFALSFGYLIGVFFELGGNVILTKHVARGFYSSFNYSLKFRIVSIVLTFAVTYAVLLIGGFYSEVLKNILYASLGIAFSSLMNLYFAFFRGVKKMSYEAVVLILQKVIFIGLCILLIWNNNLSSNALIAFAISMIVSWLIIQGIFINKRKEYSDTDKNNPIEFSDYFKDIMSLALVEVFSVIYFRTTLISLEHFAGFQEVGKYAASYKLVEAITNIPSIIMLVLFPSFAKMAVENIQSFKDNFYKVFKILFALGIVSSICCWFLGETFFKIIGKDYSESYIIIRFMIPALIMIFPNYLLTQTLVSFDKNILFAKIVFTALIVNIILSILIVPIYGSIGSAVSVGVCEMIIFVLSLWNIKLIFRKN